MRLAIFIIIFTISGINGCTKFSQELIINQFPSINQIIDNLENRRLSVENFFMHGELGGQSSWGELSGEHHIWGRFPDNLRAEIRGPFGKPALLIVTNSLKLIVLVYSEGKAYFGSSSRFNLAYFLGLPLMPTEAYMMLTGCVSLPSSSYRQLFSLFAPNLGLLQWVNYAGIDEDKKSLIIDLVSYTVREVHWHQARGVEGEGRKAALTCHYNTFVDLPEGRFPRFIEIINAEQHSLVIKNDKILINQKLDDKLFEIIVPTGFKVQNLDE